jgi:hypothetical protein
MKNFVNCHVSLSYNLTFTLLELSGELAKSAISKHNSMVLANIIANDTDFPYKSFSEVPLDEYDEYGFAKPNETVFTFQLNYTTLGPVNELEDAVEISGKVLQVFTKTYSIDKDLSAKTPEKSLETSVFRFSPYRVYESLEEAAFGATEALEVMGFVIGRWYPVQVFRLSDGETTQETLFWDGEDLVPEIPETEEDNNV